MKTSIKNRLGLCLTSLILALVLGVTSCDLEEYNPAGSTADVLLSSPEGMSTFVNRLYYNHPWKYFGREDPVLYIESSTDIWVPRGGAQNTYGANMTMYKSLTSGVGQFKTVWDRQYDNINRANAIINRVGEIEYASDAQKKFHEGQARWFRAFAYWWLCEFFGGVHMKLDETSTPVFTATRTDPKVIYDEVILPDLRIACEYLPNTLGEMQGEDAYRGRITKKAAYGLLARTALTRAGYETDASAAQPFRKEAYDMARFVIDNKAALEISLYETYDEIWQTKNNKTNTEWLAFVTHTVAANLSPNRNNPNRLFMYFSPRLQSHLGLTASTTNWEFHRESSNYTSSQAQMPTRFLLELFEEGDMRYDVIFQEKFYAPTDGVNYPADGFDWASATGSAPTDVTGFGKDLDKMRAANGGNTSLKAGDLIYWVPRTSVSAEEKQSSLTAIVDIDMRYNADGSVRTAAQNSNVNWVTSVNPRFRKYRISDSPTGAGTVLATNANIEQGYGDVSLMRFAEMQLIAAEAAMYLNTDNKGADFINQMRGRIVRPGFEAAMTVTDADMDIDFILDERARELCGEWLRWFDLHRTGKLIERVKAHNPEAGANIQSYHNLRPIPSGFLLTITNPEEFGQNPGY